MQKWRIGVDEAGRGPLAGPVAVGVVRVGEDFDWLLVPGVGDSKQLSEGQREAVFKMARKLKASGQLDFAVSLVGARVIDQIGITAAIKQAMGRALQQLEKNHYLDKSQPKQESSNSPIDWTRDDCLALLDGGLKAPPTYRHQETIIKGDQKEPVIGLASICAKVTRDRYMRRAAKLPAHAPYNFHIHKGYGTKAHRAAIAEHGLCDLHRHTFCRNCKPQ